MKYSRKGREPPHSHTVAESNMTGHAACACMAKPTLVASTTRRETTHRGMTRSLSFPCRDTIRSFMTGRLSILEGSYVMVTGLSVCDGKAWYLQKQAVHPGVDSLSVSEQRLDKILCTGKCLCWVGYAGGHPTMKLTPCLTYAVPVVALVQSPVLHLGHPQLVKLVHHNVLGFKHPKRS